MKYSLSFIGIACIILAVSSCEKRNEEFTTPVLSPIDYYDIQLISAVEDGVWLRKQKSVYDNSTLRHSRPCVFPLQQEALKLFKYDLSGQLTDSIAEPEAILSNSYAGNQFGIDRIFRIARSNDFKTYDASIFDKDLNQSSKFKIDFSPVLKGASLAFPQNCVKIISEQSIILPIIVSEQNVSHLAVAHIDNGSITDFSQNAAAIAENFRLQDVVIDESDNVFMLLSDRKDPATIINYKLVVYEKATGAFTEVYSFQNTAKIYKLAVDKSREKVHIINTFSAEINSGVVRFLSYSLKNKEASLSGFMLNSTQAIAQIIITPIHQNDETLVRIGGNVFSESSQDRIFRFSESTVLDPILTLKRNQSVNSFKKTQGAYVGYYLVTTANSDDTGKTSLLIQTPDAEKEVFLGEGTLLKPNSCITR